MFIRNLMRRLIGNLPFRRNRMSDSEFRLSIERSTDVICRLVELRFTYISPSAFTMFGWDTQALIGKDSRDVIYEEDLPIVEDAIGRLFSGQQNQICVQVRALCGDGSIKWAETNAHIEISQKKTHIVVLLIRDISERKRFEEELKVFAHQDGLTGLANRRSFDLALEREWRRTLREGGEMALLLLDVDHFKKFNDSYGHQAGDDCLKVLAACLTKHARRPSDLACRYGGEELAVILGDTPPDAAIERAEEIRSAIAALALPYKASFDSSHVTVSIGVATAVARVGGSVRMPESLLQAADHALYKAKVNGRNRIEHSVLIAPTEEG